MMTMVWTGETSLASDYLWCASVEHLEACMQVGTPMQIAEFEGQYDRHQKARYAGRHSQSFTARSDGAAKGSRLEA